MKKDIHPDVRRDPGDLHLRQHVHHAEHRRQRRASTPTCARLPPVLHRQAEDPRHRRPRRPVRGPLRQEEAAGEGCEDRRSQLHPGAGPSPGTGVRAVARQRGEERCSRRSTAWWPSTPSSSSSSPTPRVHADQALARRLDQRYAELTAIVQDLRRVAPARRRPRGGARARRARTRPSPRRPSSLAARRAEVEERLQPAARAARPRRTARTRSSRSSPARAVRSRRCSPATCCACTPVTPSGAAGRTEQLDATPVRPRRLQVGDRGGARPRARPRRARRRTPC